jgi:hypothetical protein
MKRNITRATLVIFSVATIGGAAAVPAVAQSFPGIGTVMTYNVNEGTDFLQVVGATTELQFLVGVGQILTQVQGTNPPERMQAVARQILDIRPELLSLQEVDQWYTGTFDLGHSDMESTMGYLQPSRRQKVRDQVNEIFA